MSRGFEQIERYVERLGVETALHELAGFSSKNDTIFERLLRIIPETAAK